MNLTSDNPILNKVVEYVQTKYQAKIDFPWYKYPDYFVIRNKNNKWFGIVMKVPYKKFNLNKEDLVDVLNVKIDDYGLYDIVVDNKTIFPGYHTAKHKWISILLDGSVNINKIFKLIDESYIAVYNK
ncbi:MAG: MmcQ/YjbR family DNA-binding protein [Mycoplasma sp.]|nr:MmcQ/YjbR family DNA-binding protein [Mycoplasma sp.]